MFGGKLSEGYCHEVRLRLADASKCVFCAAAAGFGEGNMEGEWKGLGKERVLGRIDTAGRHSIATERLGVLSPNENKQELL